MALTIAIGEVYTVGNKRGVRGTIGFDSSYPTGGETLTANDVALRVIDSIEFMNGRHGVLYYTDTVLPATSISVEILLPTGGAAPTSLAAPVTIHTTGTAAPTTATTANDHTETGGQGVEFGSTADASSITLVPFVAIGV